MPKNKGKGGKNRKRGKNEADDEKRELVFKEDGQEYAQVLRMLGNGRCEAMCIDGTKRLCHIRGKMHKKVWIAAGDIILVGLRDYQDDKADVSLVDLMRRMITPVMITLNLKTKTSTKYRRLERNLWFGLGYHNRYCASLKKKGSTEQSTTMDSSSWMCVL
ncbi:unnamed protein product [Lactuca saligna]|uniref:Eukaryotic translation initiation factor 4C n=1 Tax=Lactuca saligna TaxID=75948 RepID=A0AA35ZJX8_LACSI|nr:unnamed protein product [Lactuca saligna]